MQLQLVGLPPLRIRFNPTIDYTIEFTCLVSTIHTDSTRVRPRTACIPTNECGVSKCSAACLRVCGPEISAPEDPKCLCRDPVLSAPVLGTSLNVS